MVIITAPLISASNETKETKPTTHMGENDSEMVVPSMILE